MRSTSARRSGQKLSSFTLVELLIVMFIIALLTAIILAAAQGVMTSAARSRTRAEIQAMTTGLEAYKVDNGTYPLTNYFSGTTSYSTVDPTSQNYTESAEALYLALSGKANYLDTPAAGIKYYLTFKANQLGNLKAASGSTAPSSTYIQDPFGYAYGYTTGDVPQPPATTQQYPPYNGTGFFDLWSTGGTLSSTAYNTNTWINNWGQQQ